MRSFSSDRPTAPSVRGDPGRRFPHTPLAKDSGPPKLKSLPRLSFSSLFQCRSFLTLSFPTFGRLLRCRSSTFSPVFENFISVDSSLNRLTSDRVGNHSSETKNFSIVSDYHYEYTHYWHHNDSSRGRTVASDAAAFLSRFPPYGSHDSKVELKIHPHKIVQVPEKLFN